MKIKTGYLYHIKDEFFTKINDKGLMINHENGHSRPSYLAIEDNNTLWFIPLSTKNNFIKENCWSSTNYFNSKCLSNIRKIH